MVRQWCRRRRPWIHLVSLDPRCQRTYRMAKEDESSLEYTCWQVCPVLGISSWWQKANDGCSCCPAQRCFRYVNDVSDWTQVDIGKANEIQTQKSSKESTTQCKEITLWWMGDALDMYSRVMMHTYSICNVPEMTRNQDASRDEKENDIEWKPYIESYSICLTLHSYSLSSFR